MPHSNVAHGHKEVLAKAEAGRRARRQDVVWKQRHMRGKLGEHLAYSKQHVASLAFAALLAIRVQLDP
jgi:hypothetical protein